MYTEAERDIAAKVLGYIQILKLEREVGINPENTPRTPQESASITVGRSNTVDEPEKLINQNAALLRIGRALNADNRGKAPDPRTFWKWIDRGIVEPPKNYGEASEKENLWPEHHIEAAIVRIKNQEIWPA